MSSKSVPEPLAAIHPLLFRRTCGHFVTGITVVTVVDALGKPHGMTVNSFSSVSLDPPLVLVGIDLKNAILGHFLSSSHFAINILGEHQEDVSQRFSSTATDRFNGVAWHPALSGTPLLDEALAQLECSLARAFEAGDHTILIGEVVRAGYRHGKPLVYFASGYRTLL